MHPPEPGQPGAGPLLWHVIPPRLSGRSSNPALHVSRRAAQRPGAQLISGLADGLLDYLGGGGQVGYYGVRYRGIDGGADQAGTTGLEEDSGCPD